MRKKIVAILLTAAMAMGIAACGNQSESNKEAKKDDNTITVTPEEEQAEKEDEKPSSLANRIKLVFMVLLAVGIALVTYSIYKKQF